VGPGQLGNEPLDTLIAFLDQFGHRSWPILGFLQFGHRPWPI
jgi:hypothetical protein